MLRGYLVTMLFALVMGLSSPDLWGTQDWFAGGLCGIAVALVWARSRLLAVILGWVGIGLLASTLLGLIPPLATSLRSFFNGMNLGWLAGWVLNLVLLWPRSGQYLRGLAERDGDTRMLGLLTRIGIK